MHQKLIDLLKHQGNEQAHFPRTMPGHPGLGGSWNVDSAIVDLHEVQGFGAKSKACT